MFFYDLFFVNDIIMYGVKGDDFYKIDLIKINVCKFLYVEGFFSLKFKYCVYVYFWFFFVIVFNV